MDNQTTKIKSTKKISLIVDWKSGGDYPHSVAVDGSDNLYIADANNHRIKKIAPGGEVSTLAGNGEYGYQDGTGEAAQFNHPSGVAVDSSGILYVADYWNHCIRKITPDGEVSTFAGSSQGNEECTDEAAMDPKGVALDSFGNVYVADHTNHCVWKISPAGEVSTIAGSGYRGYHDSFGTDAQFDSPTGVTVDSNGILYVADACNQRIRKITPGGEVITLAGGTKGYEDGTGEAAQFNYPYSVTVDSFGNVYVADHWNHCIRKITPEGGVSTLAARFNPVRNPSSVAVDASDNLYVADLHNRCVLKIAFK